MAEPQIITSALSRVVEKDGGSVDVRIYRLENTEWSLEIVELDPIGGTTWGWI